MPRSHIGPSRGADAVTVLSAYIALLLAVPSPMVVAPLGTAGSPATLLAVATFMWWAWFHLQRDRPLDLGFQPLRAAVLAWMTIMLVAYAYAMARPIPADEILPADSGMLRLIGFAGVALVALDGIPTMARNRMLVERLVLAVGLVAVLGLVQFATKQLWVDRISIPGLSAGTAGWSLGQRSGLTRPSGTSTSPIEYAVVLTMVLPLAIVVARRAGRRRWLYFGLLGAIGFAVFLSLSRSAIVCGSVALIVLVSAWKPRARLQALGAVLAMFVGVYLLVPGVLGTLGRLFTGASDDVSIQSRTGSYEVAADFIAASPWLGRGFGTFLPKYWILDNGYLGLLIEGGVLGFAGLLVLITTAIRLAARARRLIPEGFDQDIAQALLAALAAGASGLAFFDTFGFPQTAGCFFLLVGLAGSTWRLASSQPHAKQALGREARR